MATPQKLPTRDEWKASLARRHIGDYVELTTNLKLHEWQQKHLCPRLERLATERGARILIHGPPQFGKSIVLTKRFPAWQLGKNPDRRVVVAAYNVTHATSLTGVVRDTMRSPAHLLTFPDPRGHVVEPSSEGEFFTTLRKSRNDSQPSMRAVGLLSGFTGTGADDLLVDDPYASPDDARSEAINERVWRWWKELASVRVNDDTNVVVMFHRYHETDIAGRLMESGDWEYIRFPAIADANKDGSDPTGRQEGELLSPMRSKAFLESIRDNDPMVWSGQFQGVPKSETDGLFKAEYFSPLEEFPYIARWVRYWDLATGVKQSNDWTVGALVGQTLDGRFVVGDIQRWRKEWPDSKPEIVKVSERDYEMLGAFEDKRNGVPRPSYAVGIEAQGMQLALVQDLAREKIFRAQVPFFPVQASGKGDKKQRASVWAARAKWKGMLLVRGPWDSEGFVKRTVAFDGLGLSPDDEQDAVSGAVEIMYADSNENGSGEKVIEPGTPEYYEAIASGNDPWH
jgi:hypothetical protein